jgi:hypothetical protein
MGGVGRGCSAPAVAHGWGSDSRAGIRPARADHRMPLAGWCRLAYVERVNTRIRTPASPDGLRPGQVGLVCAGRVILGDIAATLADLAIRRYLDLSQPPPGGDWLLTPRLAAAPSEGAGALLEYERILLRGLAGHGGTVSLPALPRAVLDQTRSELIQDAVRRGWFHGHPRHHATSNIAVAMAGRVLAFRRDLLHQQSQGRALATELLPYALHFQIAPRDEPLARFARAFGDLFAGLDGWYLPMPERSDYIDHLYRGEQFTPADDDPDIWLGPWSAEDTA